MKSFTHFSLRACAHASSRIPLALIIALGLGASGCQEKAEAPPETSAAPAVASAPVASPEKAAPPATSAASASTDGASTASSSEIMRIKSLMPGDRACYVELDDAQDVASDEMASFELCDQVDLVGKRVRLKREPTPIMAMSCEGNPECTKTETVNLIVAAEVVQ